MLYKTTNTYRPMRVESLWQTKNQVQAFGSISITNDIVDRLFHRASVLNIRKGISYRLHGPDSPKMEAIEKN
jgi:hypothetical protein